MKTLRQIYCIPVLHSILLLSTLVLLSACKLKGLKKDTQVTVNNAAAPQGPTSAQIEQQRVANAQSKLDSEAHYFSAIAGSYSGMVYLMGPNPKSHQVILDIMPSSLPLEPNANSPFSESELADQLAHLSFSFNIIENLPGNRNRVVYHEQSLVKPDKRSGTIYFTHLDPNTNITRYYSIMLDYGANEVPEESIQPLAFDEEEERNFLEEQANPSIEKSAKLSAAIMNGTIKNVDQVRIVITSSVGGVELRGILKLDKKL